jgi:hypothetical protein
MIIDVERTGGVRLSKKGVGLIKKIEDHRKIHFNAVSSFTRECLGSNGLN